jgi:hydrogenase 3 maturation protease
MPEILDHLKSHLHGKVAILGIGNVLRSDDGVGSLLAARIRDKVPYTVYDAGSTPENYLEKVIREKPDTVVIIDAVDFGGNPGEFKFLAPDDIKTANLFVTHNASITLLINYLQKNLKADIIILIIQPKTIAFGDELSQEVNKALTYLEDWFSRLTRGVKS